MVRGKPPPSSKSWHCFRRASRVISSCHAMWEFTWGTPPPPQSTHSSCLRDCSVTQSSPQVARPTLNWTHRSFLLVINTDLDKLPLTKYKDLAWYAPLIYSPLVRLTKSHNFITQTLEVQQVAYDLEEFQVEIMTNYFPSKLFILSGDVSNDFSYSCLCIIHMKKGLWVCTDSINSSNFLYILSRSYPPFPCS